MGVAGFKALIVACKGDGFSLLDFFDEGVVNDFAGQANGALYNCDIVGGGVKVGVFEVLVGIAFIGADKTSGHLNSGGTQGEKSGNIFSVEYTSSGDDGNGGVERVGQGDDFRNELLEGSCRVVCYILIGVSQVAAGFDAFDYDGVGEPIESAEPSFADDVQCSCRRDDGDKLDVFAVEELGEVEWQARTGDYDVGVFGDSGFDEVFIIGQYDHYVDADYSIGEAFCLSDFVSEGLLVYSCKFKIRVIFELADACAGDDAHTSRICHCSGEVCS